MGDTNYFASVVKILEKPIQKGFDFKTNAISLYNLWSYLSGFYFTIDYKYLDITCSFSGSQKNRAR